MTLGARKTVSSVATAGLESPASASSGRCGGTRASSGSRSDIRQEEQHARPTNCRLLTAEHKKPTDFQEAYNVGRYMFQKMGFKEKKERLTVMLLLGGDEIKMIAKAAAGQLGYLAPLSNASVLWERSATTDRIPDRSGDDAEFSPD